MTIPTRRFFGVDHCQYWILSGPEGAVAWQYMNASVGDGLAGALALHIVEPDGSDGAARTEGRCKVLSGPHRRETYWPEGNAIGRWWEQSGRDDEVIWVELEDWYRSRLAPKEATA